LASPTTGSTDFVGEQRKKGGLTALSWLIDRQMQRLDLERCKAGVGDNVTVVTTNNCGLILGFAGAIAPVISVSARREDQTDNHSAWYQA